MKNLKKVCCLLLALLTLLPACANSGDEKTKDTTQPDAQESQTESETEDPRKPDMPMDKMDGETFHVLFRYGAGSYNMWDVKSEGLNGEIINDSVYYRNLALEETFDIELNLEESSDVDTTVKKGVTSGTEVCDVFADCMCDFIKMGIDGYLYDWNKLVYVNADDPFWDSNAAKQLSMMHKLFVMVGDISMKTSSQARFMFFNKKLMEVNGFTIPYEDVNNGTWVFDKMLNMIQTIAVDLNGDGVMDSYDMYGMLTEGTGSLSVGLGVLYSEKNEDDLPEVSCINERTVTALEKVKSLLTDKEHTFNFGQITGRDMSGYAHVYEFGRSLFANGQFLFLNNGADEAAQFANMEDGFGILPNPKLDETQPEYYHLIDCLAPAWGIPGNVENIDKTDRLMEYWAYLSDSTVEAFYETTIKKKRLDAPEDAAMLDLVRNTIRYDLADVYDIGICGVINSAYSRGNLMSTYEKQKNRIDTKLRKLREDLEKQG